VLSHIGIQGNEAADLLAKSSFNLNFLSPSKLPSSNFIPILRQHINKLWSSQWNELPPNFATKFIINVPKIPKNTWFNNLKLSKASIV